MTDDDFAASFEALTLPPSNSGMRGMCGSPGSI